MSAILSFGPQLDKVGQLGWLPSSSKSSPLHVKWYSQGSVESPPPSSTVARRGRCCLLRLSPSSTTTHVVMIPTTQFSRASFRRLIRHVIVGNLGWQAPQ